MELLYSPISSLPRTAAQTIKKLQSVGIETFRDLLYYIPTRYKDYSIILSGSDLESYPREFERDTEPDGNKVTVQGEVLSFDQIRTRTGLTIQKAVIQLDQGTVEAVWFNQRFLFQLMRKGASVSVSGLLEKGYGKASIKVEEYEICTDFSKTIHTGRLVPVYSEIRGLSSKTIREKVAYVVTLCAQKPYEELPEEIIQQQAFKHLHICWRTIHFPVKEDDIQAARRRLAFDEVFSKMLSSAQIKKTWQDIVVKQALPIKKYQTEIDTFIEHIGFPLTKAQERVVHELLSDLEKPHPMNRLLQGDVGSGKTVVAAVGAYAIFLINQKTLIMAPTDILARQHFLTCQKLLQHEKLPKIPHILLHTASNKNKKDELEKADIIIGTHALITDTIDIESIGFVVVDEQHKFGVAQRAKLKEKGISPHMLSMTATPIPRTVCLTLYGELDISIIDELPRGRKEVKTYLVPTGKRADSYAWMKKLMNEEKIQIYLICPFIEESTAETLKTVKAAQKEYEYLAKDVFPEYNVGLMHGRMKADEKQEIMERFSRGDLDILVSTSLVEVGVDVPNANLIVIEGAERFGLAQLHQLRGRVGRSDKQAYCLLFPTEESTTSKKRLELFTKTTDGFKLAEYDLQYRGSGDIYGLKQHGEADLKIASYSDTPLISKAQETVEYFMKKYKLEDYPALYEQVKKYMDMKIAKN